MHSTIDDLLASPQGEDMKYELWQGELRWSKRPGGYYEQVKNRIYTLLNDSMIDTSCGQLHGATVGYQLQKDPDTVLFPEISVVQSVSRSTFEKQINISAEIPSLVVEIPGPADRFGKVASRISRWLNYGVKTVIVLECESKFLQCFCERSLGNYSVSSHQIEILNEKLGLRFSAIDVFSI